MKTYRVKWEIDIEAGSPDAAARKALDIQRDPASTATVFDVACQQGGQSEYQRVDVAIVSEHRVKITQVFRAVRTIEVVAHAEDQESAIELIQSGNIETPDFDSPAWKTTWDLQNEEITAP